jgi:predicted dinucleotide-binding enzyme
VGGFHNVAASRLARLGRDVDCDVLICGDDRAAKNTVIRLADAMGVNALDAGPLANGKVVEGLTAILIGINKRYGAKGAGVRITNVDRRGVSA